MFTYYLPFPVPPAYAHDPRLSCILTPPKSPPPAPARWAADNGCFNPQTYQGDIPFLHWLARIPPPQRTQCQFAVAPDIPYDAAQSLRRSAPFLPIIRAMGFKAALAAQDNINTPQNPVPWPEFDVLFLGGTTEWKLSPAATILTREAVDRGIPVHMGRVNSFSRLWHAASTGVTSADGTGFTYSPSTFLPALIKWLDALPSPSDPSLFPRHSHRCEVCATPFTPAKSHAKTCSPRCRKTLSRRAHARQQP